MWGWVTRMLQRPDPDTARTDARLAKLDSEADVQVNRAHDALDEWDNIKARLRLARIDAGLPVDRRHGMAPRHPNRRATDT